MELLEETECAGPIRSAGDDSLVPALPENSDMVPAWSPPLRRKGIEEAPREPSRSPEIRPRSYRNSAKGGFRSLSKEQGREPFQKAEKGDKAGLAPLQRGWTSSRPTTAGAESATNSADHTSTSWRDEWTPGNVVSPNEKPSASLLLQPLPSKYNKPPPLPPLPMRPPESGSVLNTTAGSDKGLNLSAGKPATPEVHRPAADVGAPTAASDAALKRLSSSSNAKVATPPPTISSGGKKWAAGEAGVAADQDNEAAAESKGADAPEALTVDHADEGATIALEESLRGSFSEMSRSFAYMDSLA